MCSKCTMRCLLIGCTKKDETVISQIPWIGPPYWRAPIGAANRSFQIEGHDPVERRNFSPTFKNIVLKII